MASPLLESRDGRLLLLSQAASFLAHGISSVALPWLVLDDHGSRSAAGLVLTFTTLPYVVFGLAAGVIGDRLPSRRVIWVTHAAQALVALAVPVWALLDTPPVLFVLGAAFAIGAGRVFSDAAVFGAVARVVGRARMLHGQATLGAAWAVGLLAGPALGGALIAAIGPARCLIVEAAALGLAAAIVRAMRLEAATSVEPVPAREIVREGLRTIFGDPVLRSVTIVGLAWSAAEAGSWGLAVPLLRDELGLGSTQAGIVLGAGAAMGILASPLVGALDARIGGLRTLLVGVPLSGVAVAALGVAPGFAVALVAYCTMELCVAVTTAAYIGERQRRASLRLQSTVGIFGRMLVMLALATGSAVASALAALVSLQALYLGMAALTVAVAVVGGPALLRHARAPAGA